MAPDNQEFVKRVVFTTDRCSREHQTPVQIKKGLQNRSLSKVCLHTDGLLAFVLQVFLFCALFRFASVLEGTGKGADYEESKQKQWSN